MLDVAQPNTADTIKSRTFGSDPARSSEVGVAFAQGLQDGGAVATAKHFPGLGRATVNTDDAPVTIAATSDQLQSDLEPFKARDRRRGRDGDGLHGELPDARGQEAGRVLADDRQGPAARPARLRRRGDHRRPRGPGRSTSTIPPAVAATSALEAGDDLLLYATEHERLGDGLRPARSRR